MRTATLSVAAAALASTAQGAVTMGKTMEEWYSRSIYQTMTDRFALTNGSTVETCTTIDELVTYCGGTWRGLINHLDYIQGMGFTAVQISPVIKNMENDTYSGESYHGYWQTDLYSINEHFGTVADLKDLASELHARDMWLLADVVVNNMAQKLQNQNFSVADPPYIDYSAFNPFSSSDDFHPYCNVTEWDNSTNYQDCWLYPEFVGLVDLKTESQTVVDDFGEWIQQLIANYSIDGLRIDAAKHVNDGFLPLFLDSTNMTFALGEVLTGVVTDMCRYQAKGLLQGMPNYLEYYQLLTSLNGGKMTDLYSMIQDTRSGCNDTLALGSFAENHDMPRFASTNSDMNIAHNAMAWVILNDGIPLVYQGQEQHYTGAATPENRVPIWNSGYNTSAPLYQTAAKLNKLRNQLIALTNTTSTPYVSQLSNAEHIDDNHLCMSKGPTGKNVVYCIVNQGTSGTSYQLSVGGFSAGDKVVEVLSCTTSTADSQGNVTMYMDHGIPKAYTLLDNINGTGICNTTEDAETASKSAAFGLGPNFGMGVSAVLGALAFLFAL